MNAILNYLTALLIRIENRMIGSVDTHIAPLKDIVTKLEATQAAAVKAADVARAEAAAQFNRAEAHVATALSAEKAAAKIAGLFN